jgi:hypothetical protein
MKRIKTALIAGLASATALLTAATSIAVPGGSPTEAPAAFTPWLLSSPVNQNVQQLVPCGRLMYAVGRLSRIGQGNRTYTRGNAFSFSQTTGAVTAWDPEVNGTVQTIALSPDCATAYLGGRFTSVHGTKATNLVAVNTSTGAVRTGFARNAGGKVNTLQYTSRGLLVGGVFTTINGVARSRFASLNPATGAVTSYANLSFSGTYPQTTTKVYNSQLSHAGTRLLIEGVFTSIAGKARRQVAILDLGATSVRVSNWYSTEFDQNCVAHESFYVKGGAWSPDDATIYVATTGYKPPSGPGSGTSQPRAGLCDAAAAFRSTSGLVRHVWINYTGCDSYYAVAADTSNVYVGGHARWANNPNGCDAAGPGAVARPGIAGLNPSTGLATSWNPTRSRGHGVNDLEVTRAGLWIASDTGPGGGSQMCGKVTNKGGICFLPN